MAHPSFHVTARARLIACAVWVFAIAPVRVDAQTEPNTARTALSALTNPAISAIGWFQAVAGSDAAAQAHAFEFKEIELALQSAVDPFTRAEFFVAFAEEGFEVEEATITWLALPGGGQAKLGKFRADLGKFNRTHPPETPFADRPLAAAMFLGEEGLATTGASLSALLPTPWDLYWDVTVNGGTAPEQPSHDEVAVDGGGARPLFGGASREDLLWVGRTSAFVPLGEAADANLGISYANARAADALQFQGNRAQLVTGDLTLRWKNPRRSIYRSLLVQSEWSLAQGSDRDAPRHSGGFAYAIYQFARQWRAGLRYDWTERPGTDAHESGALALIAYQPSEFSTLSLQARRVTVADGSERDAAFFKWTFNIGPHGSHPY